MIETIGPTGPHRRPADDARGLRDLPPGRARRRGAHLRRAGAARRRRPRAGPATRLPGGRGDRRRGRGARGARHRRWSPRSAASCPSTGGGRCRCPSPRRSTEGCSGSGFTTFVLTFGVWAVAAISFAVGDPAVGARHRRSPSASAGRCRSSPWRPLAGTAAGARVTELMARRPALYRGLRLGDAIALALAAAALAGSQNAFAVQTAVKHAADPGGRARARLPARRPHRGPAAAAARRRSCPARIPRSGAPTSPSGRAAASTCSTPRRWRRSPTCGRRRERDRDQRPLGRLAVAPPASATRSAPARSTTCSRRTRRRRSPAPAAASASARPA